jgi:hypothetical protein
MSLKLDNPSIVCVVFPAAHSRYSNNWTLDRQNKRDMGKTLKLYTESDYNEE